MSPSTVLGFTVFYDLRAETCHEHLNARVSLDVGLARASALAFRSAAIIAGLAPVGARQKSEWLWLAFQR